jgi:hypothetical protein
VGSECDALSLQDLNRLEEWNNRWLLELKQNKCYVMHTGHCHTTGYTLGTGLNKTDLQVSTTEKDLGSIFTNDLKFSQQCRAAANAANRVLGMIKRQFHTLDQRQFQNFV